MKDERKLDSTYQKILQSKPSAIAWSLQDQTLHQVNLKFSHYNKDSLYFDYEDIQKPYLRKIIGLEQKIRIYIESEGLFLFCKVKEEGPTKLCLSKPELHEFEDRREELRAGDLNDLKVQILENEKILISKNCTDIGLGGFSIVLMKTEKNPLKEETEKTAIIEKMGIQSKVQVLAEDKIKPFEWENTPYGGTRISFKFLDVSDKLKIRISKYLEKYKKAGF